MLITRTSQLTGKRHQLDIPVTEEEIFRIDNRWHSGELIQNIVPHLPKEQREYLISGATPEEWEDLLWI
jgi:hypothetical protein